MKNLKELEVLAPASLMLCGEHSVVYGKPAIVAAIQQWVSIKIIPRSDDKIIIDSELASHTTDIHMLAAHNKLSFVMAAIKSVQPQQGFELIIQSEIDSKKGFGSSAAITVATLAALRQHVNTVALHEESLRIIRMVQGRGSGADCAAAIFGGLLAFFPQEQGAQKFFNLPVFPDLLSIRYAGYKTPTAEVLALLAEKFKSHEESFREIYENMGVISNAAIEAANSQDWNLFYVKLNSYQKCMEALGVCDTTQKKHLSDVENYAKACKISGSGLGDCIFALSEKLPPHHESVQLSLSGLIIH